MTVRSRRVRTPLRSPGRWGVDVSGSAGGRGKAPVRLVITSSRWMSPRHEAYNIAAVNNGLLIGKKTTGQLPGGSVSVNTTVV